MTASDVRTGRGLRVVDDGPVRSLVIDRQHRRNALDTTTVAAMVDAVTAADADPAVRVLVLTGSGDVAFSSGIDLKEEEPAGLTEEERQARRAGLIDLFRALDAGGTPVITRLNGVAIGGGVGLALSGDVVVAAEHARLATPEVDVGRWPMAVGAVLLRVAPFPLVAEMLMTGRSVTAGEAVALGVICAAVPMGELDAVVAELATAIASKPAAMLALGRRTLRRMASMDLSASFDLAASRLAEVIDGPDAVEGLARFRAGSGEIGRRERAR